MSYTMKGSPAKLGTIQGTSGHKTALKMASPNKGIWEKLKGVFKKKENLDVSDSKYKDWSADQLEDERVRRQSVKNLDKQDKKTARKARRKKAWKWQGLDTELGDMHRVSQGGPWNEKKKKKKKDDFDVDAEENKLNAQRKHQNVHTPDPDASKHKTKSGKWMTAAQNVKSVEKSKKADKKEKKYWDDYKLGDYSSGRYQLGKRS